MTCHARAVGFSSRYTSLSGHKGRAFKFADHGVVDDYVLVGVSSRPRIQVPGPVPCGGS